MKKLAVIMFYSSVTLIGYSQGKGQDDSKVLLKELSENGCKCVDSISASNKSKEQLSKEIANCINQQAAAYQLGSKLFSVKDSENDAALVDGKKEISISIDIDEDSKEYQKYYFELERYMLANCKSLKEKMASSDAEEEVSMSKNPKAIEYYNRAVEESKKENYKKSISFYEKAVQEDPTFIFAWDNLGICYRRLKDYDNAIMAYSKSLELNPKGKMPLQNIAVVYRYKEDYLKAIEAYEKLALVDENNPEVFFGLGQVYAMNLNNYEKGLDNICKAYNLYIEQKSPYRTDAETVINQIYGVMKKAGDEDKFNEILKANNIVTK